MGGAGVGAGGGDFFSSPFRAVCHSLSLPSCIFEELRHCRGLATWVSDQRQINSDALFLLRRKEIAFVFPQMAQLICKMNYFFCCMFKVLWWPHMDPGGAPPLTG